MFVEHIIKLVGEKHGRHHQVGLERGGAMFSWNTLSSWLGRS